MNNVAQAYRTTVATLTQRLERGERDIDALVAEARQDLLTDESLSSSEVDEVMRAVRRDLYEFSRS